MIFMFTWCSVKRAAGDRTESSGPAARGQPSSPIKAGPPPRRGPAPWSRHVSPLPTRRTPQPGFGNAVSHSNRRTRRRFDPNIQSKRYRLASEDRFVRLALSTESIKTVDKIGIERAVARIRARGGKV
jgi:large subunit ribosomal protein L28